MTTSLPPAFSPSPGYRPTRRTLARGAAWAVPVLAVGAAAPASAASPCDPIPYELAWRDSSTTAYTQFSQTSGVVTVSSPSGGPVVGVSISASVSAPTLQLRPENLSMSTSTLAGLGQYGLILAQRLLAPANAVPPGRSARQSITFAFDRPVSSLSFTVTDIDSDKAGDNFVDAVEVTPDPDSVTHGPWVTGLGTQASPARPTDDNRPVDESGSSSDGNATFAVAGPVSALTLVYWNTSTTEVQPGDGLDQTVFVTNISFTAVPDGC